MVKEEGWQRERREGEREKEAGQAQNMVRHRRTDSERRED